jgi:RNA polymerase sigma-70 factor (ECF subfamily)
MGDDAVALPADVVARARQGETAAFAAIYDRFSRPLHAYAFRLLGNVAAADDVVQETFIQAWRSLGQLREEERLEPWLYRIASNKCFSILRRRRLLAFIPLDWQRSPPDAGEIDPPEAVAERDLVARALRSLPPGQAACLILRHADGFSCDEIGEILGLSPQAVWTRLSRGRAAFAEAYRRQARGET